MRILLLSDTHGDMEIIDRLAQQAKADAVIHAGDFGFYDDDSVDRLEARELFLRVVHSHLSPEEKTRAKKLRSDAMRALIREKLPLSQCDDGFDCNSDSDCLGIGEQLCLPRAGDGCSSSCQKEHSEVWSPHPLVEPNPSTYRQPQVFPKPNTPPKPNLRRHMTLAPWVE